MLIIMRKGCTPAECARVEDAIRAMGYEPLSVPGADRTAICVTGNRDPVDPSHLSRLEGVLECIPVTKAYKLVSREVQPQPSVVIVDNVHIGGDQPVLIAGPPSVETEARTLAVARKVKTAGAHMFRAGAYKPGSSPYAFQGLGKEGLRTLRHVKEETGLPIVSEVIDVESIDIISDYVDVLQVGARNMQNYSLLRRLGTIDRPVLLKRGIAATLEEWLMAAEYLLAQGNRQVILCERGIRTSNGHSGGTLDLNVVPMVRGMSHLPIIVDPSHGAGARDGVRSLSRAALAAGAQGLLIEVHTRPDTAYVDADQTIDIDTFTGIVRDSTVLAGLETVGIAN